MKGGAVDVTRELFVPTSPERVWRALTDPAELEEWFANEVELDLERGEGAFRWENGEARRARVDGIDPGRRLELTWWDDAAPDEASTVRFTIEEADAGTRLVVTESAGGPSACASGWGVALELRLVLGATVLV
jgi:uncharacterized protein YndB with AHSA1/START domain